MISLEQFIKEIAGSAKLRREFETIRNREALDAFLEKHGCKATGLDFVKYLKSKPRGEGEISDDDAESVAGGAQLTLMLDPAVIAAYGLG